MRRTQKTLASEMTKIIHDNPGLESALKVTQALFSGNIKELSNEELKQAVKGMPKEKIIKQNYNIVDFLVASKVVSSKRQAREDINNGAIYINGEKISTLDYELTHADRFEDNYTVVRRGKKKYLLVEFE